MAVEKTQVVLAAIEHLTDLVGLFDGYRVAYGRPSDMDGAKEFLQSRIDSSESTVFLAYAEAIPAGFVQIYPSFSSVHMCEKWVLNDVYVDDKYRRRGIAEMLLRAVVDLARLRNVRSVILQTAQDNAPARALYEKMGFALDLDRHYSLMVHYSK